MQFRALVIGGGGFGPNGWSRGWHAHQRRLSNTNAASSSGASANGRGSYFDRVKGWQGPWKAALTSGSLSATGDLLAQLVQGHLNKKEGKPVPTFDPSRTLRMFGFGLCFYGPYQYYWYNLLEHLMPVKTTATFLAKVAANQLLLAPVTLSVVFSWNLGWTGQAAGIPDKLRQDLWPTMQNGWKFWVPAASLNFYAIPLQQQVLYMSMCGVLWTAYLSYASITNIREPAAPEPAPAPAATAKAAKGRKGNAQ